MRIKLDENIPLPVAEVLSAMGHDADTVPHEGLAGAPDGSVFGAAQREQRFLVTQDLDFSDVRQYVPGTHHGVLVLRLSVPGRIALRRRIVAIFATEAIDTWSGCLVIATDLKLRVRRPSTRPS